MTLRRGLTRVWLVLSALYVAGQIFSTRPEGVSFSDWWTVMWVLLMPPLLLAIALAALGWIINGFMGTKQK
jgi:hypothetical protein